MQFSNSTNLNEQAELEYERSATNYLLIVLIFLFGYTYNSKLERERQYLPGPYNLPFIGSLYRLIGRNSPNIIFHEMSKKYGQVFFMQFGTIPTVVLNGIECIREAFVNKSNDFNGRPNLLSFQLASDGKSMAFNGSDYKFWNFHRRLAEKSLRLLSDTSCDLTSNEARNLALELAEANVIDPLEMILWSVAKVDYSICYGDYKQRPEHFEKIINALLKILDFHQKGNMINFVPWARPILYPFEKYLRDACDCMMDLTKISEAQHIDDYDRNNDVYKKRDMIDILIDIGLKNNYEPLDKDRTLHTIQDVIGAGLDIIYVALNWCLIYLAKYPKCQAKIHDEIESVLKDGRQVNANDQSSMPQTMAFIYELLRHVSVVPFALPHETTADTSLNGYKISNGTMVMVNIYSITRDENLFPQAENFNPERFLSYDYGGDCDGITNSRSPKLNMNVVKNCLLWGLGRRRCIGEKLGKMQLFLYLVNILQKLNISSEFNDHQEIDIKPIFGVVQKPKACRLRFTLRN